MYVLYRTAKSSLSIFGKFLFTILRTDIALFADFTLCALGFRLLLTYTPRSFSSEVKCAFYLFD